MREAEVPPTAEVVRPVIYRCCYVGMWMVLPTDFRRVEVFSGWWRWSNLSSSSWSVVVVLYPCLWMYVRIMFCSKRFYPEFTALASIMVTVESVNLTCVLCKTKLRS